MTRCGSYMKNFIQKKRMTNFKTIDNIMYGTAWKEDRTESLVTKAIAAGFRSIDTVEKASLDEIKFNYSYEDEDNYYFIDPKSFEQINIKKSIHYFYVV